MHSWKKAFEPVINFYTLEAVINFYHTCLFTQANMPNKTAHKYVTIMAHELIGKKSHDLILLRQQQAKCNKLILCELLVNL